jgi:hypothetical protein
VDGTGKDAHVERYELQPIDGQTNGPQLLTDRSAMRKVAEPTPNPTTRPAAGR